MIDYNVYVYEVIKRYGRERKVFVCKFETVLEAQSFVSNKSGDYLIREKTK